MKSLLIIGALVWLSVVVYGTAWLTRYENTAAESGVAYPTSFPSESRLERDPARPTLIFFAHPKCPCTRAAINELARLMTDIDQKAVAYVVFIKPRDESDDWTNTELRSAAGSIPNVTVVTDNDERETHIFNAQTSSLTLLYDSSGKLRFDGGITAGRGHEGDNAGRTAIFDLITADAGSTAATSVFGCPLHQKDCPGQLPPGEENEAAISRGENQ